MKTLLYIPMLLALACSCSSTAGQGQSASAGREGTEPVSDAAPSLPERAAQRNYSRKVVSRAGYTVRILSALDFLARKNEQVSPADRPSLEKEVVVMLEMESPDAQKDFFDSPQVAMSREEGMQYLVGGIASDLSLFQGDREFSASGVSFERAPGAQNKIRVLFFFKDVALGEKMRIKYFDRILDAGIINFGINN